MPRRQGSGDQIQALRRRWALPPCEAKRIAALVRPSFESQLLRPERLEAILGNVLDRRQEQGERRREHIHIAELNKRAAESELRLKRLYDAIEASVADIHDPALKDRIDGLKAIRDQASADAERAQAMLDNSGAKAVTLQMARAFADTARQHIRLEGGGYRRDHLRALAQRVELPMARSGSWDRSPGCFRRSW
ncbi:resolvase domain protein [Blastochloris viridis]|uniref:Resolvase domain protein n=1 Tax=Blastochloris viridis TaxID=1079 RepID=A0A182D660_BLAVI|nr:resolvase domain protein [Blastochloris viridis]